jgi:CHAT domain-containing protein
MGKTPVIKEQLKKIKVVVPSDTNLTSALEEREFIQQFGRKMKLDISVDSKYEQVLSTLETGGFDMLHFSTHGRHSNSNPLFSVIELENGGEIRPEEISGIATTFGQAHPVVILNACQSGIQGFSLTGIQGWATRFLEAGASAFIGTLWSVSDESALTFTKQLYDQLSMGIALGEAVRIARNHCKQTSAGDPSWLAYELYGQPNSTIKLG